MQIIGPQLDRASECEAVLRALPAWFGIEHALLMYKHDTATFPTFAVDRDGTIVAFLTLREHFEASWEIHCMAVDAACRGSGIGTQLIEHSQDWLRQRGARFLQVKTVAPSGNSAEYTETRKFYEAVGFAPLEVFPDLWDSQNPALQMIKTLNEA